MTKYLGRIDATRVQNLVRIELATITHNFGQNWGVQRTSSRLNNTNQVTARFVALLGQKFFHQAMAQIKVRLVTIYDLNLTQHDTQIADKIFQ